MMIKKKKKRIMLLPCKNESKNSIYYSNNACFTNVHAIVYGGI